MSETTVARRFWQIRPQDESAGATYPEQRLSLCELYCFLRLLQSANSKHFEHINNSVDYKICRCAEYDEADHQPETEILERGEIAPALRRFFAPGRQPLEFSRSGELAAHRDRLNVARASGGIRNRLPGMSGLYRPQTAAHTLIAAVRGWIAGVHTVAVCAGVHIFSGVGCGGRSACGVVVCSGVCIGG